ncbi:phosphoribosylglycinamide formyltransferase [Hansschlegelia zhihuaiae]|uniref:Phosphoribosylglycinamide formyltransferase n=1 Tax=Hansschlegelia zhihuaiae TaxID=405005 RepID=A0A4Q0MK54_9HYPH|nr:phosphoribosylglycinamide formyltransferase [Hansschlegelia zhihuaiae]RXF73958.1 phosphoribosylglycinamide formyltransferase [Hansschlegelia zhihuaiae]
MSRSRVAILVSGRGSNMAALIDAAAEPSFPAEIIGVISNRPSAGALAIAERAGVATTVVDHKAFPSREAFDDALHAELVRLAPDVVCFAGFMRLLTAGFIERWEGRMLNIHPALLPSFKGLDTHARALEAGVKLHGCTVHLVTAEMDAGPIVAQAAAPVLDGDDEPTLAARVLALEHRLYPRALAMWARGEARLAGGRVRTDGRDGEPPAALIWP